MYTAKDLVHLFEYKRPSPEHVVKHEDVRAVVIALAVDLNTMLPEGREKAVAITKLQEVMFWANAAVALESTTPVGNGKTRH